METKYLYTKEVDFGLVLSSLHRKAEVWQNLAFSISLDNSVPPQAVPLNRHTNVTAGIVTLAVLGSSAALIAIISICMVFIWLKEAIVDGTSASLCMAMYGCISFIISSIGAYSYLPGAYWLRKYPNTLYLYQALLDSQTKLPGYVLAVQRNEQYMVFTYEFENPKGRWLKGKHITKREVDIQIGDHVMVWYANDKVHILL